MTDRERQRQLDLLAMQFAQALEAGDFAMIDRLWTSTARDPELETVFLETAAELAEADECVFAARCPGSGESIERKSRQLEVGVIVMDSMNSNRHLSRISTLWTLVGLAHQGPCDEVRTAQQKLLDRYGGAIHRYLLGALRDADAAEDLFQEFAYHFLHGDFHGVDPQRGRFRDYVKGVLFHLVADYHRKRQRLPRQLVSEHSDPAANCEPDAEQEQAFLATWRDELLMRTWSALAAADEANGQSFHAVLRFRAEHPNLRSHEMAEKLSLLLGKPLTAAGVRKTLERARERFADLLLDAIADELCDPTVEHLEGELIDLNLLDHCRPALERRRGGCS